MNASMVLWTKLKEKIGNLIERIFRRKRLAYLEAQNHLLIKMNELLCTGDSVRLSVNERKFILEAIEDEHFKARVELPKTKKFIRIVRNNVRDKLRASLKGKK